MATPTTTDQMWTALRGIGPCRVSRAKMVDPERSFLAPAFNVRCSSTDAADDVVAEAAERGWRADRTGPCDVYVDPTPDYEIESFGSTEGYTSVWADD